MKKSLVVALFAVMGIAGFADTKTTYRDAMGRVQGTQTTDSYGRTTYRDAMGRVQGTQTTDCAPYYHWKDVRPYLMQRINAFKPYVKPEKK